LLEAGGKCETVVAKGWRIGESDVLDGAAHEGYDVGISIINRFSAKGLRKCESDVVSGAPRASQTCKRARDGRDVGWFAVDGDGGASLNPCGDAQVKGEVCGVVRCDGERAGIARGEVRYLRDAQVRAVVSEAKLRWRVLRDVKAVCGFEIEI